MAARSRTRRRSRASLDSSRLSVVAGGGQVGGGILIDSALFLGDCLCAIGPSASQNSEPLQVPPSPAARAKATNGTIQALRTIGVAPWMMRVGSKFAFVLPLPHVPKRSHSDSPRLSSLTLAKLALSNGRKGPVRNGCEAVGPGATVYWLPPRHDNRT